jgi:hypothetical protein
MESILLPLDLRLSATGYVDVVTAIIQPQQFCEPFFVDTLTKRFEIKVNYRYSREFVRPLILAGSNVPIKYLSVDEFTSRWCSVDEGSLRLVFHMSRCGSTLATQMLGQLRTVHVISEPQIINRILSPLTPLSGPCRRDLLKSAVAALQASRPPSALWTCIKLRSWISLFAPEVVDWFPKTPWIFCHRNGIEVMASALSKPPGWLRARYDVAPALAARVGVAERDLTDATVEEYAATMLRAFCSRALACETEQATYLHYPDIAEALPALVEQRWGIRLEDQDRRSMAACSALYSKDESPRRRFVPDGFRKRAKSSAAARSAAEALVEPVRLSLIASARAFPLDAQTKG